MRIKSLLKVILTMCAFGYLSLNSIAAETPVVVDEKLLRQSDYIDVVYTKDKYAWTTYQTEESYQQAISTPPPAPLAVWLWRYSIVFGHENEVISKLAAANVSCIYMQLSKKNLESCKLFLAAAKARNIKVFALDGKPADIDDFSDLIEDIAVISKFNSENKEIAFAGFQVDVEPYIKPDFNLRRDYYAGRYIELIKKLKKHGGKDIKISAVIPFWYDQVRYRNKPLSERVTDIADEIVIMSYRTDYAEIVESALDELIYAKIAGKPVWLGLETTPIDDEKHYVIDKATAIKYLAGHEGAKSVLSEQPGKGLPVHKIYEVRSEMLTFNKNKSKIKEIISKKLAIPSFHGYVIHSYESYFE